MPNVIKASQYANLSDVTILSAAPNVAKRRLILDEAAEEAKKILETAQHYGDQLIQESKQQIKEESAKIRLRSEKEGYQAGFDKGSSEGYQSGYQQGLKEAKDTQQQLLDDMKAMLEDLEAQKEDVLDKFSSDIQKLAFEIARKVIHTEINLNEDTLASIIEDATEAYRNQAWIKLTVPKTTEKWVSKEGSHIVEVLHEVSDNVKVIISEKAEDGGCLIDMPEQLIDAGIETQLSNVRTALQL